MHQEQSFEIINFLKLSIMYLHLFYFSPKLLQVVENVLYLFIDQHLFTLSKILISILFYLFEIVLVLINLARQLCFSTMLNILKQLRVHDLAGLFKITQTITLRFISIYIVALLADESSIRYWVHNYWFAVGQAYSLFLFFRNKHFSLFSFHIMKKVGEKLRLC